METDPETERRAYARTHYKHWIGITAEDIPPGWIDDMVKRLFEELNRQMIRLEKTSTQASDKKDHNDMIEDDPEKREKNARTLTKLRTDLEHLTKLEMDRASLRATKSARKPSAARAKLAQQLAETAEPGAPDGLSGKAE